MAAQLVVALLAVTSLGAASELDCKELVKPLVLDSHSPVSISDHFHYELVMCEEAFAVQCCLLMCLNSRVVFGAIFAFVKVCCTVI